MLCCRTDTIIQRSESIYWHTNFQLVYTCTHTLFYSHTRTHELYMYRVSCMHIHTHTHTRPPFTIMLPYDINTHPIHVALDARWLQTKWCQLIDTCRKSPWDMTYKYIYMYMYAIRGHNKYTWHIVQKLNWRILNTHVHVHVHLDLSVWNNDNAIIICNSETWVYSNTWYRYWDGFSYKYM